MSWSVWKGDATSPISAGLSEDDAKTVVLNEPDYEELYVSNDATGDEQAYNKYTKEWDKI